MGFLIFNMVILFLVISCISAYIYYEVTGEADSKYEEFV